MEGRRARSERCVERLRGRELINKLSLADDKLGWGRGRDGWRRPGRKGGGENEKLFFHWI